MATILTNNENYKNIANSIRSVNGKTDEYYPRDMATAISELSPPTAVLYVEQSLTDEQQAQARENIGSASEIHAAQHATDGSDPITPSMIGAAESSHSHSIASVTNLQSELDSKATSNHTHTPDSIGAAASSHTHSISNITDLQTTLDGKSPTSHTHTASEVGAQATITGAATTITSSNLTTGRALVSDSSGKVAVSAVTSTELGYLDGVTSSIQTQLDGKAGSNHGVHVSFTTTAPKVAGTAAVGSATTVSRSDHIHPAQTTVSGNAGSATKLATARTIQTNLGSTSTASFDGSANVTPGVTGTLPIANGGTGATTTAGVLTNLGITATATELNYVDGVTSNIQTQLNGKAASSHGTHVTYSTTAPKAAGTAAVGTASNVARGDHVHPAQTTVSGNAGTATKLATARTIRTNLGSTSTASFDGSANVTPGVTGTLPVANGGTGATTATAARTALGAAPTIQYGTSDVTAGSTSSYAEGTLYVVIE